MDTGMTAQRDGGMTAGRRRYGTEGDSMMWGYARVVVESV